MTVCPVIWQGLFSPVRTVEWANLVRAFLWGFFCFFNTPLFVLFFVFYICFMALLLPLNTGGGASSIGILRGGTAALGYCR